MGPFMRPVCSGAMQASVPSRRAGLAREGLSQLRRLERPKSMSLIAPVARFQAMLAGLRSLWMTPARCTRASARATPRPRRRASRSPSGDESRWWASDSPPMSSSTMTGRPSVSSSSGARTTPSPAAIRVVSNSRRRRAIASAVGWGPMSCLTTRSRPSSVRPRPTPVVRPVKIRRTGPTNAMPPPRAAQPIPRIRPRPHRPGAAGQVRQRLGWMRARRGAAGCPPPERERTLAPGSPSSRAGGAGRGASAPGRG